MTVVNTRRIWTTKTLQKKSALKYRCSSALRIGADAKHSTGVWLFLECGSALAVTSGSYVELIELRTTKSAGGRQVGGNRDGLQENTGFGIPTGDSRSSPVSNPQCSVNGHGHPIRNAGTLRNSDNRVRIFDPATICVVIKRSDLAAQRIYIVHLAIIRAPIHSVGVVNATESMNYFKIRLQSIQVTECIGGAIDGNRAEPESTGGINFTVVKVSFGSIRLDVRYPNLRAGIRI